MPRGSWNGTKDFDCGAVSLTPTNHLTPFGVWLWRRFPWPRYERALYGQGYSGLCSPNGFRWIGFMADYYHGFLHPSLWRVIYWRRSFWLLGRPIVRWTRLPRWRLSLSGSRVGIPAVTMTTEEASCSTRK